MLNFEFLEKGLGVASLSLFVYDASKKQPFNGPTFAVWLILLLEILAKIYVL